MKANVTPEPPPQISLDELAQRCHDAGVKMSRRNEHRALLLSAALALQTLGQQLESASERIETLQAQLDDEDIAPFVHRKTDWRL